MTAFPQLVPLAPALGAGPANGLLTWDGIGAVILWIVFVTLISALLGILFEHVSGSSPSATHPRRRRLEHAKHAA